jgi:type II secretory pathway pseudopilin PulG
MVGEYTEIIRMGNVMVQLHWNCLRVTVLLILPIATINPAQAQTVPDGNAEGGKAIAALTRAQQAYFLENSEFSRTLSPLSAEIPRVTPNYVQYIVRRPLSVVHYAIARRRDLKSYIGQVAIVPTNTGESISARVVCENDAPGVRIPPRPLIGSNLRPVCAPGTTLWSLSSIKTPAELDVEVRAYLGAINRSQQAYFLENSRFASTLEDLQRYDIDSTIAYDYSVQGNEQFAIQYGVSRRSDLKSYVGAVTLNQVGYEYTTTSILCENLQLGPFRPAAPIILGGNLSPVCAPGTQLVEP